MLESMVKPWWLSMDVFVSVLILLGLTVVGWVSFLDWIKSLGF